MSKKRSALVVGATGLVGMQLVQQLCAHPDYISVTALVRNELLYTHKKLTVQQIDFDELVESQIDFVDDVFCCLGSTQKKAGTRENFEQIDITYPVKVASLAKKAGAHHFIVISAMGANEKSFAYYNRVKGKLEQQLQALNVEKLSIVRPSLLVGKRSEFRLGEKIGELLLRIFNPILIGPLRNYRSIRVEQVAQAMVYIALHPMKQEVSIYPSNILAKMVVQVTQVNDGPFDWAALKDEIEPLDEDVVFDRDKINALQQKITNKK